MRAGTVQLVALIVCCASSIASAQKKHAAKPPALPCGDILSFQILLDSQGFSPGQIDGRPGPNFAHAIAAMQGARGIAETGEPDCDTWHALGGDHSPALQASYAI